MGCGRSKTLSAGEVRFKGRGFPEFRIPSPSKCPVEITRKCLSDVELEKSNFNCFQKSQNIKYYKNQLPPDSNLDEFKDELFPANANSILGLNKNNNPTDPITARSKKQKFQNINIDNITWLRPNDIFPGGKFAVFENEICIDDIKQGNVGNCYFMAAISAMAENPQLISQIFKTQTVQENGCYEILFRLNGEWKIVLVDDYFPCDKKTKEPIFSKPIGAELWVMLLEKAWAKVNGGYKNIIAGFSTEVLSSLTNFPKELILHSNIPANFLWEKIKLANQKKNIMACCTKFDVEISKIGLVSGHEYSLIAVKEGKIDGKHIKLLKLRNPWGCKEWNGNWSDKSTNWTKEAMELFYYKPGGDDGNFYIEFSDFVNNFIFTEFCYVHDPLGSKSHKFLEKSEMKKTSIFQIYIPNKTLLNLTVIKKHYRFHRKIPEKAYLPFNITLVRFEGGNLRLITENSNHFESPLISKELDEGFYYGIFTPFFEDQTYDKERKYIIDASAENYFNFTFKGFEEESLKINNYVNKKIDVNFKNKYRLIFDFDVISNEDQHFHKTINDEVFQKSLYDISNYDFIYKNINIDFSDICKKIDSYQAAVDYYTKKYPKYMTELLKIPKVEYGKNELIFKKYEWPNCFYIGDWKLSQPNVKHGRGIFIWSENVFTCGIFENDQFNGMCFEYNNGFTMKINYTNGKRNGIGECSYIEGHQGIQEYSNGKFIKYV